MYQPITYTFVDGRDFDGNAYEVADQSIAMLIGTLQISVKAAEVGDLMARNAYMERNMALGNPPAGDLWPETVEGRRWVQLREQLDAQITSLGTLRRAASFDPKHPPKE